MNGQSFILLNDLIMNRPCCHFIMSQMSHSQDLDVSYVGDLTPDRRNSIEDEAEQGRRFYYHCSVNYFMSQKPAGDLTI